jgi:hypothetical protein
LRSCQSLIWSEPLSIPHMGWAPCLPTTIFTPSACMS